VIYSCLSSYRPLSGEVPVAAQTTSSESVQEDLAEVGRGDGVEEVGKECVCQGGHCCCVG
jgi:hypothetical protein